MLLFFFTPLHGGHAGHAPGAPTGRVEGELAEPDNLVMAWPGIGWGVARVGCGKVLQQSVTQIED